ncbi:MAG: MinD/ParA family protein [Fimbriimonadaceae bacterium]
MLTVAITSGKGGVGKTTFSANLAAALKQMGERTLVFDADLQLANLDVVLGINPEFTLQHVVAGKKGLRDIITTGPGGVDAVAGASGIPALMSAGPKRMGTFIPELVRLERDYDVLLFDTAAGLDNRVITFMKLSHEVIIVCTPDPTSITDAYATIKTICRRDPDAHVRIVFNMAHPLEAEKLFAKLEKIVWQYLGKNIELLGSVRYDREAIACGRKRKLFVLEHPDSEATEDIIAIGRRLKAGVQKTALWAS